MKNLVLRAAKSSRQRLWAAVAFVLLFLVAFTFVTLRYRQHVLTARSWNSSRVDLWHIYGSLESAARSHDNANYAAQLTLARKRIDALATVSRDMNQRNADQRERFLASARGCFSPDASAFLVRTSRESCADLLRFPH